MKEEGLQPKDIDVLFGGGGTKSANSRKCSRTSSEQSRGDDLEWGRVRGWLDPLCGETIGPEEDDKDEERGRKRTRDEDDTRYGKRRRVYASNNFSAVPSSAASQSHSGTSVSSMSTSTSPLRPGLSLQERARLKNLDPNKEVIKQKLSFLTEGKY